MKNYKDLIVWQKSIQMVLEVYQFTENFPKSEMYGLTSQIRRSALSIPANIAEGSRRYSKKDFRHFLRIAFGSASEIETYLEIIKFLPFGKNLDRSKVEALLGEITRMLNKMTSTTSY